MPTKYKGTKKEETALNAFINFMRASLSLNSRLHKHYLNYGLTESQFGVLSTLSFSPGPLSQKENASKLLTTAGNMTMVIHNLQKRGLIKRSKDGKDRRITNIELTKEGKNLIGDIFPEHVKAIVNELSYLNTEEQENLRDLCRKLGRGKENKNKGGS